MNGVLVIHKKQGFTSHDVVAKLRGICKQKKIGHTGTLDPEAEGVLPVCLGNATKLCDMLTDRDKAYETVFQLGVSTDTQDASGMVTNIRKIQADEDRVLEAALRFVGKYKQVPPMYSAKKVNGKKLYELAREGKVIERTACEVEIYSIELIQINMPFVKMKVRCSKGTYIRTLCHDIGESLGCGAMMASLLRISVGGFLLKDSKTLDEVAFLMQEGNLESSIIPTENCLSEYTKIQVLPDYDRFLYNGNQILKEWLDKPDVLDCPMYRTYDSSGTFLALYSWDLKRNLYKPVKMFFA